MKRMEVETCSTTSPRLGARVERYWKLPERTANGPGQASPHRWSVWCSSHQGRQQVHGGDQGYRRPFPECEIRPLTHHLNTVQTSIVNLPPASSTSNYNPIKFF
ncbi:uncharacterized protein LOC144317564 [Canis aureus]